MNNYDARIAYITHFEVHPKYKHQGLGRKIMETTICEAKSKGFDKIQLEVSKDNAVAVSFYESFGFCIAEDRVNKHLMTRNI